jgi:DNA modification methylase
MKFCDMTDLNPKNFRIIPDYFVDSIWINQKFELKVSDFGIKEFHGRYHPIIPFVMMKRYTKENDVIWDPFAGGGTTIDVGKLLNRKVISNDIHKLREEIILEDSRYWHPKEMVQLVMLHPPYWDMIKFSDDNNDLSNCKSVDDFMYNFGLVIDQVNYVLDDKRILCLVISDVYKNGEQIPLDFYCFQEIKKRGFTLKARIIKDFGETKGFGRPEDKSKNLWKYRCLKGGFWKLGIDNILVFQKK